MKFFTSGRINLIFWISETVILILSNTFRGIKAWNIFNTLCLIVIALVIFLYCIIHSLKLMESNIKKLFVVLIELSFVAANAFIVASNIFWIKDTYEINFIGIVIFAIMLCPMFIVNSFVRKLNR